MFSFCLSRRALRPPQATSPGMMSVDPTFITTYITSVCKSSHNIAEANRCMASLYVPPIEDQWKIMKTLRAASQFVDINPILGPCMNLLVHHEHQKFEDLINAYIEYEAQIEVIKHMVADAMPITGNIDVL